MDLSLTGRRALIGGGSQGIGQAIAKELSLLGVSCTLLARSEHRLRAAVEELDRQQGQQHDYLVADFDAFEQLADIVENYTRSQDVHILVNNSGGPPGGAILDAAPEAFLKAFQQHLICNQLLAKAVVPGMRASGYGRIINIISTSVKIPLKGLGVSNTIRGAVASWSKTLANELGADGITVNNVLPGATATARLTQIIANKMKKTGKPEDEVVSAMLQEIPMKRFAQPNEVAAAAAFLASPAAAYINGVSIPVDGGRTGSL